MHTSRSSIKWLFVFAHRLGADPWLPRPDAHKGSDRTTRRIRSVVHRQLESTIWISQFSLKLQWRYCERATLSRDYAI